MNPSFWNTLPSLIGGVIGVVIFCMTFFTRAFSGTSKLSAAIFVVITANQIYSAFQRGPSESLPQLFMLAGSILGFVAAIRLVLTAKVAILSTEPDSVTSDSAHDA